MKSDLKAHGINSLTVELTGGLGNQLFGLAAALGVCKKLDMNTAFSLKNFSGDNPRKFELEDLCNSMGLLHLEDFKAVFQESGYYEFDNQIFNVKPQTLLRGYFQNFEYFKDIQSEIRESILMISNSTHKAGSVDAIAVHQRRGDYLLPVHRKFHGLASERYLISAVRTLRNIWGALPVVIFSDSPDEGRALSRQISNSSYFDDREMSPFELLLEMSSYRNLVGSNSSFSWWAAFLADHKYGNVIFPKPWITGNNAEGLMLDGWIRLPIDGIA